MKKIALALIALLMAVLPVAARDKVYRDSSVLPAAARATLTKAFPKAKVNRVKVDKGVFGKCDYEVVLSNGAEIEFNSKGEWKEVDCGHQAVPDVFVMKQIRQYISSNYKGAKIVQIEKNDNSYDIELSNGVDLEFDRLGRFLRIDD